MALELLWHGGWDPELFEEDARVLDLFHCGICLMVAKDMVETKCGHVFCEDCVESWRQSRNMCPIDRTPLERSEDVYPIVSMRRQVDQFKVKCPNDCGVGVLLLQELKEHVEVHCTNMEEIKHEDFIQWKTMRDFESEAEYEVYMRKSLRKGMLIKAVDSYEKVKKGDQGIFIQSNDGKPPCQVRWQTFGHKYWLPWKALEIAELSSRSSVKRKREIMKEIEQEKVLRRRLKPGTKVMAMSTFQSVCQGDVGEFLQFNEKYPPCQVRWEGYGNTYWVFWKTLAIIDDKSEEEIKEMKRMGVQDLEQKEEQVIEEEKELEEVYDYTKAAGYRNLADFDSELEYADYLKEEMRSGMLVRMRRDYEQVKKGDIGRFEKSNGNYPPCQVRWSSFGHKYWVYWRDLEIVEPKVGSICPRADELMTTKRALEHSIDHEAKLRKFMKPGTKVVAIKPYRCITQGDVGEFVESNEKFPPVKIQWKNYGSSYWVFWDNIDIVDGMEDSEIVALLHPTEEQKSDEFPSEVEYSKHLQTTLQPGMVVRATADYEQVKKGDVGMYMQHNKNYPPCQVRWKNFGHKYWLFWRDLEIVPESEAAQIRAEIEAVVAYENKIKNGVAAGKEVMLLNGYQCVAQGDVGVYIQHNDRYPPCQIRWKGYGDPFWAFWKDLALIDDMTDAEIRAIKLKNRPTISDKFSRDNVMTVRDFDCEVDYVEYMKEELDRRTQAGDAIRIVTVNSFGTVDVNMVGLYMEHNSSYPPCMVKLDGIAKKKWCFWKDIALLD